jgi:hypothetical protein
MEPRRLPLATFRCHVCGVQVTVQTTYFKREEGKQDTVRPLPLCSGREGAPHRKNRMDTSEMVQVSY